MNSRADRGDVGRRSYPLGLTLLEDRTNPAPATHFLVTAPATAIAGTAFSVVVSAVDNADVVDTTYAGTVTFTSSDTGTGVVLPANYTFVGGDAGVHSFINGATLVSAGTQTITATDTVTSSITGTSNSIAVSAATATHLAVVAPANVAAGTPFNFTVTAQDQFNNTATTYVGTVTFTSSDGAATLPANSTLTAGTGTFSATLPTVGTQTITATDTVTATITGTSGPITVRVTPPLTSNLAIGGATNGSVQVFVPGAGGQYSPSATITPFGAIAADVRTAVGDVNGDGIEDTIAVTGPGVPIRFMVISGVDNTTVLVPSTPPFAGSESFTGGGFVSAGDLDGDGRAEIAVSPDRGGGPRVTIFSLLPAGLTQRANFFGITGDPGFRGGVRTVLGDVNRDGVPELAVAAGFTGGPRVALFRGASVLTTQDKLINDFFAFPGSDIATLRNGAYVVAGDVNGDGFADLAFGGGPGGAPRIFILSGALLSTGNVAGAYTAPIANFFVAGNSADRGGVRVAMKDADGDTRADVVAGSGEGSPARARIYLGANFTSTTEPTTFQDLAPFGGVVLTDGVFVG